MINLTVSTDMKGKGGVATVLTVYQQYNFFVNNNVELVVTHDGNSKLGAFGMVFNYFKALCKLFYFLGFRDVGLVHIHMASRGSYIRKAFVARMAKFFNVKLVIHLHGAEFKKFYEEESTKRKQRHIRNTFDMADCVIVLSTQWRAWISLLMKDPSRVLVIYNAVPKLCLSRDNVQPATVLFLGRLGRRKGVDDLINSFVVVRDKVPHARLLLGGDGDIDRYKVLVKKLQLDDAVEFLGWVSGEEKLEYLNKADVYTLPSYNEGFPMGLLEAMSAKIPIVASNAGGIPDAITNGKEGVLIDAGDVAGLAQALIDLLTSSNKKQQYAEAANFKYNSCFSPDVVLPRLDKVYADLLK